MSKNWDIELWFVRSGNEPCDFNNTLVGVWFRVSCWGMSHLPDIAKVCHDWITLKSHHSGRYSVINSYKTDKNKTIMMSEVVWEWKKLVLTYDSVTVSLETVLTAGSIWSGRSSVNHWSKTFTGLQFFSHVSFCMSVHVVYVYHISVSHISLLHQKNENKSFLLIYVYMSGLFLGP